MIASIAVTVAGGLIMAWGAWRTVRIMLPGYRHGGLS